MLKHFLTELGGPIAVAEALGDMTGQEVKANAVYQWPYRGEVPHRWRFYVAKLAKKKRIKNVPPEIQGYMQ